MDTKALRQKILDLAIRGKLVPQDPNDEPASVLLERIRAQKQQMVKEGKLKAKDIKNDTVIFVSEDNLHYEKFQDGSVKCIEDEIPFEIPQDWEWTRLGSIAIIKGGKRIPKGMGFSDTKTDHIYIRVVDMKNNSVNLNNLKYISDEVFSRLKNYTVKKNDLYITIAGTIGEVGEIPEELDGMNLTENAAKITGVKVYKSFLCLFLQADFLKKQFNYKTYQVAMPKLGLERIQSVLIPICGTKMQHKIVTSVRELLNSIESIHTNQADIIDDIKLIKSSILDLAIRGKLIPQDPNDEPASVLLERIRAEKEELIKQGKIKRDKKESVIFKGEDNSYYEKIGEEVTCIDDDIPFEIPDNWCWCRMKQLMYLISGVTYNKRDIQKEGIRILRGGNLTNKNNIMLYDNDIFLPEFYIDRQNQIQDGDIIIVASTGSTTVIGKPAFVESHYPKTQIGGFLKIVRPIDKQAQQILWLLFQSNYYHESILDQVGGVNINNIKSAYLENMLISVPSGRELALIVEKYLQLSLSFSYIEASLN